MYSAYKLNKQAFFIIQPKYYLISIISYAPIFFPLNIQLYGKLLFFLLLYKLMLQYFS